MFEKINPAARIDEFTTGWEYRIFLGIDNAEKSTAFQKFQFNYGKRGDLNLKGSKDYYYRNKTDGYLYLKGFSEEDLIEVYGILFL